MKKYYLLLFLLFLQIIVNAQQVTVDLSTGRNDNGTLMPINQIDPDWHISKPDGSIAQCNTRETYTGWAFADMGSGLPNSVWVTTNNYYSTDAYYNMISKPFSIPAGATGATLNLRSLSFARNWTFLVKKNTDGTETETQISATSSLSDGAKGWLNSRSPIVSNYALSSGNYYIKVKLYSVNNVRPSIDVNANVAYTPQSCSTSAPAVISPVAYCQNTTATKLTATGSNLLWYSNATGGIGSVTAPTPSTAIVGATSYYVSQTVNGCESTRAKIELIINAGTGLVLTSSAGSDNQNINLSSAIQNIIYTGSEGTTVTGLPSGVIATTSGNIITISGTPTAGGVYNYTVTTSGAYGTAFLKGVISVKDSVKDWALAPNSYIFTGKDNTDGLYIPVKKAYEMWKNTNGFLNQAIPSGTLSAFVYWEDVSGLINSSPAYKLNIIGTGDTAKIEVPINKGKGEGNAVISFHVGSTGTFSDPTYWSWHVWVTDDPTNGSKYRPIVTKRLKKDGTIESIPDADWGWMDRNLGAVSKNYYGPQYDRSGGLLYQWGRKDPFPDLVNRAFNFYEVQGAIGKVRHYNAVYKSGAKDLNELRAFTTDNSVINNIRFSVNNPLKLIYNTTNYTISGKTSPYNWFGSDFGSQFPNGRYLATLNLWSDNSKGIANSQPNFYSQNKPYQEKSSYDPCPNGWRIPSMLADNGNLAVRIDYSPFGVQKTPDTYITDIDFNNAGLTTIKPADTNVPTYLKGMKLHPYAGVDFTNVGGKNMGIFTGTGLINNGVHNGALSDQHEIRLWTASMVPFNDGTPGGAGVGTPDVAARSLHIINDKGQPDIPNPNFPNVVGRYKYYPSNIETTSSAMGCRCIKDPLYVVDQYDFATEYFQTPIKIDYTEGLSNSNSYMLVKSNQPQTVEISVSKAFSVYNQLLSNGDMLSYNSLKSNVYWTTNTALVQGVSINQSPTSTANIKDSKILITIAPNQIGNAVVTLHNGSITNPIYWSWHIWVGNTLPNELPAYLTEKPVPGVTNYINYVEGKNNTLQTIFMDRDLGALEDFPTVADPNSPTATELSQISKSGGMLYQFGRKDPLPSFVNPDGSAYPIYMGSVDNAGAITYTALAGTSYDSTMATPYNTYTNASNANVLATDKKNEKVAKVISYAVKNPLIFMYPSVFRTDNKDYTLGNDWLSDEPNVASNRWGESDKKSPYDPCPEGWRIPDLLFYGTDENAQTGTSPWYKLNVNQRVPALITSNYNGKLVRVSASGSILGYVFQDLSYNVGNYANSGIRGHRNSATNPSGIKVDKTVKGNWASALVGSYLGRANMLYFSSNLMASNYQNNDPYYAVNCRCAKIKYDDNGNETGPLLKLPVNELTPAYKQIVTADIVSKIEKNDLSVFPNPVRDLLYIDAKDNKIYEFKIFDMMGQLVKSGRFENNQTNLSSLISGVYLISINNSTKIFKIIKK
jgi:hypothetical protein